MAGKDVLKELSTTLSQARILLAADVDAKMIDGVDINALVTRLVELHKNDKEISIADKAQVAAIIDSLEKEKAPLTVEVNRQASFKPKAADVDARYQIINKEREIVEGTTADFVNHFRNRVDRIRRIIEERRIKVSLSPSIETVKSYTSGREVTIAGIITTKTVTKKGNLMVVIEDETSDLRTIFVNGAAKFSKDLFEEGRRLINDEVVAIRGKVSNGFLIANEIIWPDIPIKQQKQVSDDIALAFMSDIHVGSRQFMEKNFSKMLRWLNGDTQSKSDDLAGKIKYIVMAGDVADGVGVYPDQEPELSIPDIYLQYKLLFGFISQIPDYIHVFVMPGNHDAVGRSEPQPPLGDDLIKDFKADNVHIISNPCSLNLHGLDVLAYHGTSLDSIIRSIPDCTYASPEKAMIELLKRRHLSPVYGGNVIIPSKDDQLVIDKVPDILHMGHIHKNGLAEYHGVKVVNSGTWQNTTALQLRYGHVPTPCVLPVYEPQHNRFSSINFEDGAA